MMCSAPLLISSSASRKPQVTPTVPIPALRPVFMSTDVSPTKTIWSG